MVRKNYFGQTMDYWDCGYIKPCNFGYDVALSYIGRNKLPKDGIALVENWFDTNGYLDNRELTTIDKRYKASVIFGLCVGLHNGGMLFKHIQFLLDTKKCLLYVAFINDRLRSNKCGNGNILLTHNKNRYGFRFDETPNKPEKHRMTLGFSDMGNKYNYGLDMVTNKGRSR